MDIAVDLHIHSALSPCADDDMTPNNIVNMALLKKLDAIAITDHNSCGNVEAVINVAGSRILILPGIEVQTKEEVHLLCYFGGVDKLLDFGELIESKLPDIVNVPQIFGNQLIMNERDEVIGRKENLLISSVDLSIDEVLDEVYMRDGVSVPAHIDKPSYSIISQLGFVPPSLSKGMLEISRNKKLSTNYPSHRLFYSSDAHQLWQILERESFLTVDKLSFSDILYVLGHKN